MYSLLRHGRSNKVPFVGGSKVTNNYAMRLPAILCIQIGYETVRNGHISFFGHLPLPFELVVAKMQSAATSILHACRPHCHLSERRPLHVASRAFSALS